MELPEFKKKLIWVGRLLVPIFGSSRSQGSEPRSPGPESVSTKRSHNEMQPLKIKAGALADWTSQDRLFTATGPPHQKKLCVISEREEDG